MMDNRCAQEKLLEVILSDVELGSSRMPPSPGWGGCSFRTRLLGGWYVAKGTFRSAGGGLTHGPKSHTSVMG
jgi:hypothetical protein